MAGTLPPMLQVRASARLLLGDSGGSGWMAEKLSPMLHGSASVVVLC